MSNQDVQHRRWLLAVYAVGVIVATLQRGVWSLEHTTFAIFRQSFLHLVRHQNLYAAYPLEQGGAPADLFKYSPSAAMLFAPLAAPPYPLALLGWNALNAGLLIYAVTRVLPPARANLALLLLAPEAFVAIQSSSSNGLVTALLLLGVASFEGGRLVRGSLSLAVAASLKIFPLAGFIFAIVNRRRREGVILAAVSLGVVIALPLLAVPAGELLQQYRWWMDVQLHDARDIVFGLSVMRQLREWSELEWPNWAMQLFGTILFLAPLILRRDRWSDRDFRLHYLCSLLVYVVLFNHQAERQSFIIAATGAVIWFVSTPRTLERATLLGLALVGVPTFPYIALWLVIQVELLRGGEGSDDGTPRLVDPRIRARAAVPRAWSRRWRQAS